MSMCSLSFIEAFPRGVAGIVANDFKFHTRRNPEAQVFYSVGRSRKRFVPTPTEYSNEFNFFLIGGSWRRHYPDGVDYVDELVLTVLSTIPN